MNEKKKQTTRCGFVSIVGRPNVGKSTLFNAILNEKVAIVSPVPQTTRNKIRGVYTEERGQIVFNDTPGLHLEKDRLDRYMNRTSIDTMNDADCIIHLVDARRPVGQEEEMVVDRLKEVNAPIILGLNKLDLKEKYVSQYIMLWQAIKGEKIHDASSFVMLPLSGKTGFNVDKLLDFLFERLPEGPLLFPEDLVSDCPQKIAVSDIIREKLFCAMREEVPHSLAVLVEQIVPRKKKVIYISAQILVERDSQKEIVIGKKGHVLKKAGSLARQELEDLLEAKVFLEIHVKWKKNWRDDPSTLLELGYAFS